ncbi:MAG: recombinase family protein [Bacillota bacterium]|nr:recombinase family protein [Bacillota bacterium]
MKFDYARVSTRDQNLEAQLDALAPAGCDKIITEKASGNGSKERPELDRLVENLREGDVLVVYKLDRLGRSTFKLLGLTEELQQRGVEFISLRDYIDTSSAIGKAMFSMLAVLAEMERELIVERTQAGLQAARKRGRIGGRPRVDGKVVEKALKLYNSKEYSWPIHTSENPIC